VGLTKSICILNPIYPLRRFRRRGVHVDIIEDNAGCVHQVDRPQLGLHDVEVPDVDVADVPQDEGHGAAWTSGSHEGALCLVAFVIVPYLAVAVDAAGPVAVDPDVVSG
jgi:hypothetical protein